MNELPNMIAFLEEKEESSIIVTPTSASGSGHVILLREKYKGEAWANTSYRLHE